MERRGTYINAVDLPEELDKRRQKLEDLKQEQIKAQEEGKTIQEKIRTEQINRQLAQAQEETKVVEQQIQADAKVYTAQREAQAYLDKDRAKAMANKIHTDVEINRKKEFTEIEINIFRARINAISPEIYAQIQSQGKWADAIAQMKITYPQIMMTGGGNSSSGDPISNYYQLLQLEHLETLINRLNPGTPTVSLPPTAIKSFPPPNQETKSLPKHSTEPHCPVVLLLDTSSSMSGEGIDRLNDGITAFGEEFVPNSNVSQSVELAIVTFNSNQITSQEFVNIDEFVPVTLKAEGETTIGKGIDLVSLDPSHQYLRRDKDRNWLQYFHI
ncbi:MAG: hypothetical protein QNJ74_05355 [Trichodesmium sp. MO_231.B1]|nr:hypothetical protein [Trichodesmium sp. MO_231.B1]